MQSAYCAYVNMYAPLHALNQQLRKRNKKTQVHFNMCACLHAHN